MNTVRRKPTAVTTLGLAACVAMSMGLAATPLAGGAESGKLLLPTKVAVDSSGYEYEGVYGRPPMCLYDGVRSPVRWREAWMSRENGRPHWVELVFDGPVTVGAVAIHWNVERSAPCTSRAYTIQAWEGGTYRDIVEVKGNPAKPRSVHAFDGVTTERLRILQPPGAGPAARTNVMWIAEVEAYDGPRSEADFGTGEDREQLELVRAEVRARTIGLFRRSRYHGRTGAIGNALLKLGKQTVELDRMDERELKRCAIVVIAGTRHIPNRDTLINYIHNGGGVLLVHDACGRSGGSLLPDIWQFKGMGHADLMPATEERVATQGVPERFRPTYGDHACLERGKKGTTWVTDAEGNDVVVVGRPGKGKVVAMGHFPGLSSGTNWDKMEVRMPEGAELALLTNSLSWLAAETSLREAWKDSRAAKAWRKCFEKEGRQFTDMTEACGMTCFWYSKCVAMADVNEDGRLDIFATRMNLPTSDDMPNLLYRNDGDWRFTDISVEAGVGAPPGIGSAFADIDGDGHVDLFVCWLPEMGGQGRGTLYLGDGQGGFRDVTDAAGLGNIGPTATCMLSDVDHDGDLDLYLAGFASENRLYRNRGDGTFEDATEAMGLAGLGSHDEKGYGGNLAARMADLDGDGWQDLACFSRGALRLFRNNAGKGFEEVAEYMEAGAPTIPGTSLGLALGDFDNDGDLDLYASGVNKLLRNDGAMSFADISAAAGLESMEKNIHPYCPILADYDNDGRLDLFLGTGGFDSFVYRNNGDQTFTDVTGTIGLDVYGVHGCNFGDLDGDGDLDFYATAWAKHDFKLLRNNQDDRNYLNIRVKGRKPNTTGIGAAIRVWEQAGQGATPAVLKGYREVIGGRGAMYTCPVLEQHIGVPQDGRYDVEVFFPVSGKRVTLRDVSAGQTIIVDEPE